MERMTVEEMVVKVEVETCAADVSLISRQLSFR